MQAPGSEVGRRFGPYELRSLLGTGGMGEVYEAYDTVKDRVVALKLLSDALAGDPEYQIRFRRESQAAARLAEPHIIPIHDWGVIEGRLFIDMRLVAGSDLRAILQAEGPLSPQRAVAVVEQIAAALDAAHENGLVHRDVKPANILVTPADFAYLADFGIAHHESDTGVTQAGVAIGSYTYMAPERFDHGPITPRADIYSLTCVLHECLTGATPFPATSMGVLIRSHMAEPPPRGSIQRTGLPAGLDDVIACGMAKDPHERFATAGDLAIAARAALNTPARPPQPGVGAPPGDPVATPAAPVPPSSPPTGGIPTLVVRMPNRDDDAPDPTTTLPAIIPGDPTSIRPADSEFTPFTYDEPATEAPPESPGIRPFPDAHLYEGEQLHPAADPGSHDDRGPVTGGMPVADFYPPDQATRIYGETGHPPPGPEESTRMLPSAGAPRATDPYPGDSPHGYGATEPYADEAATRAYRPAEPYTEEPTRAYQAAPARPEDTTRAYQAAEPYRDSAARPAYDAVPGDPGPTGISGYRDDAGYGAHPADPGPGGLFGYHRDDPASAAPPQDPYAAAYEAGYRDSYAANAAGRAEADRPPRRSPVVPILTGIIVFALVVIVAVLGIRFLGSGGQESPSAADDTGPAAATTTAPRTTTAGGTTTGARTTTSAPATRTTAPADLPAGAQPCPGSSGGSRYGSAATGTAVTSCEFAEAVRDAYLDPSVVSAEGESVPVEATSPVTGQSYTLECVASDGLVTCRGGNNAIIYLY
ncbi:protein kinase domain-containing protein [Nocardia sp. NPDC003345]